MLGKVLKNISCCIRANLHTITGLQNLDPMDLAFHWRDMNRHVYPTFIIAFQYLDRTPPSSLIY